MRSRSRKPPSVWRRHSNLRSVTRRKNQSKETKKANAALIWPCRRVTIFALHNYPLQPRSRGAFFFLCAVNSAARRIGRGTAVAQGCAGAYRVSVLPVREDAFSSSASQRIPVTAIRADYEFAKAFYTPTPPRPRLGILRRLERRCSGRCFFHSRCADRNGTRTRSINNRKPRRQAEKEECVAHGYLLGVPSATTALPFASRCCSEARVNAQCPETEKIDVYLFQPSQNRHTTTLNPAGVARRTHLAAPKSGGPAGCLCTLWIFRLDFPAAGSGLYPLAKVPAGAGPGAFSCRVACAIGRRAAARRIRRPPSPRVRDHDLASLKFEREKGRRSQQRSALRRRPSSTMRRPARHAHRVGETARPIDCISLLQPAGGLTIASSLKGAIVPRP